MPETTVLQTSVFVAQCVLFVVQIAYAGGINSVALKALSYHTAVESVQTAGRIMSSTLRNKPPCSSFSYGYARCPVLFEFSGMAIITMMCASVSFEAVLRMNYSYVFNDIVVNSQDNEVPSAPKTNLVAMTSLIFASLNAAIIFVVQKSLGPLERPHGLTLPNSATSYFCFCVLGTEFRVHLSLLAVVFFLFCSWLVAWTGYGALDSIGALGCVALIAPILDGLIRKTASILLQSAPAGPRAAFDRGCREVSTFEGVVECSNEHFWVNAVGLEMGTITVRVRPGVDAQEILGKVRNRLSGAVSELTVQIEGSRPQAAF